eukprot:498714_1
MWICNLKRIRQREINTAHIMMKIKNVIIIKKKEFNNQMNNVANGDNIDDVHVNHSPNIIDIHDDIKDLQISNNEGKDTQSYWDYIKQIFHDKQRTEEHTNPNVALSHNNFTLSDLEVSDTESSSTNSEKSFTISEAYSSKNEGVVWWNRNTPASQKTSQEINTVDTHTVEYNNCNHEVDTMCTHISKCSRLKTFSKRFQQYNNSLNGDDNFYIGLILNDFMHFLHQHDTDEEFEFISNP